MLQDFDGANADDFFNSPAKPLDLKTCSVYDLPVVDTTGLSKGWRCRHCGGHWAKRNSTKVVAHLARIRHELINVCDFNKTMPSKEEQAAYRHRGNLWRAGRSSRAFKQEVIDNHLTDRHDAIVRLDDVRKGDSGVRLFDDDDVPKQGHVPRSSPTESITSYTTASTSGKKRDFSAVSEGWSAFQRAGFRALPVGTKPRMSLPTFEPSQQKKADQECTLMAGQWVAATGQDFNILEDPLTKKFLESYKCTSSNYKLPSRKRLSGDLLDINYKVQETALLTALKNGADLGGVQFCSDFATIKGNACLNILASGPHAQSVVLDIVDCHEHLAEGGIKDGRFVFNSVQPWVEKVGRANFDVWATDGGSNMVLGGKLLKAQNPRVHLHRGIDHGMALCLEEMAKIPEVFLVLIPCNRVCCVFGNGTRHRPHAAFVKVIKELNGGTYIGFIHGFDGRYGSHFKGLIRMIRLKPSLEKTIYECPPITLNEVPQKMKELLVMPTYWDLATRISKALYFLLRILHLGDSKEPGFDRLYYYIRRMEQHLVDTADEINLADMNCSDAKHMYSFLNRFFASGRVPLTFKFKQEADDHKFVVRADPSKDDEPEDMAEPQEVEEEGTGATAFVEMLQKKGPNPKPLNERLLAVFKKRTDPMKCSVAISGWLTCPVKQIQDDAKKHAKQEDLDKMTELCLQWHRVPQETKELQQKHDDDLHAEFLRGFHEFSTHTGALYGNERPCWRNTGIKTSDWHYLYSVRG